MFMLIERNPSIFKDTLNASSHNRQKEPASYPYSYNIEDLNRVFYLLQ